MSTHSARGMKRTCQACETRFYDLNRSPIVCPSCGTTFVTPARDSRRAVERDKVEDELPVAAMTGLGAAAGVAAATASGEELPEIVSVEDAMPEIEGEDDEIEAGGEEETFLEEEEEGDDVGNLIDNPIEGDEEQA